MSDKDMQATDDDLRRIVAVDALQRDLAAARAELEAARKDAVPIADILSTADHIENNGTAVALFGGDNIDEGRCRVLCAMYLRELVHAHSLQQQIDTIDAAMRQEKS